ncbi:VWA-like domain-containing protein [Enterocloster lavalensis]|uniref:VWA-like domain-containing protein n=1 Tax=Enterocloster lavalensis TaxID=460384 RepID=UPI001D0891C0|nr:VWA-like domain-containing protein [Enterocloster lavalensis]MCB6344673.1 VWA-like domain-containing protein [Enterocloster lavalensis]
MEAEQALRAARSRILKRISFLSPVLEVVEWREQDGFEGIGTDGRFLLYGKTYVREIAEAGGNGRLEREYLHAVCHIICRHPSQCPGDEAERELFGICADLKAGELYLRFLECVNGGRKRKDELEMPWDYCNMIRRSRTDGVYVRELYREAEEIEERRLELEGMAEVLMVDDHRFWRRKDGEGQSGGIGAAGSPGATLGAQPADSPGASHGAQSVGISCVSPCDHPDRLSRALEAMQLMAGRQISLMLFGGRGYGSGSLGVSCYYEAVEENHRSYREFLEQYLAREEVCREDDSEIDYIWYTYGMERWGNIGLVESPEVTEQPVLKQIAIAIDTSGSCQGEPVRLFLRETANILKSYENMEFDILVFQVDSEICREDRIVDLDGLKRYLAEGRIDGGGGTDFIPVIRRLEELNRSGREAPFKLLIYLSDGMGRFPEYKPEFDVAFALVDCGRFEPELPEWVIPLYLTGDEKAGTIRQGKAVAAGRRECTSEQAAAAGRPECTSESGGVLRETKGGAFGGFFGID